MSTHRTQIIGLNERVYNSGNAVSTGGQIIYARFGKHSDVHVYADDSGYLNCCACHLDPARAGGHLYSTGDMIAHLREHAATGHLVPVNTIAALEARLDKKKTLRTRQLAVLVAETASWAVLGYVYMAGEITGVTKTAISIAVLSLLTWSLIWHIFGPSEEQLVSTT